MEDDTLVLCYHAVSERWPSELAVTPAALSRQVTSLLDQGYRAVTFTDAALGSRGGKVLAITFDDAYESTFTQARPVLAEIGVPATLFVPTDFPDSGVPFPLPGGAWIAGEHEQELLCMSWDEIRQLRDDGWEIGGHTRTHPWLTKVDDEQLRTELAGSRQVLTAELGTAPSSIAYPYGDHDDRVVAAATAAGYDAACTVPHRFEEFSSTPMRMGRIDITRSESPAAFRVRTSLWSRRARTTRAARGGRWLDTHRPRRSTVLAALQRERRRLATVLALRQETANWRGATGALLRGVQPRAIHLRDGTELRFDDPGEGLEQFTRFFVDRPYTRHFPIRAGDLVVDVGAGDPLFAAFARSQGAARVLAVEDGPSAFAASDEIGLLRLGTAGAGAVVMGASEEALRSIDRMLVWFDPDTPGPRVDEIVHRLQAAGFRAWLDLDPKNGTGYLAAARATAAEPGAAGTP
jgi:peptidoglycan/xylan/chitin deacetylase (PgdA/CDA1 family)